MADFAYTARDFSGQKISGTIAAGTQREAVSLLSSQNLFPLQVTSAAPPRRVGGSRLKPQMVSTMYTQLAALLRSGVPLLRSLHVLRDESSHPGLASILDDIYQRVEEGESLADAMSRHPRTFSDMVTSIIRAGGEGGFLEDALDHVAQFTERQQDLKSRTTGALVYPVILAIVGTVIVNVLVIFFVPKFESLFEKLREIGQLPALTGLLLTVSRAMQAWWPFAVVLLVVALLGIKARLKTPAGQRQADRLKLRIPLAGPILLQLAVARFCRVLGTLLHNGVPIVKSLEISSDATGNRILSDAIQKAAENISAGQSLARPLGSSGHFPRDVVEMIAVAEESNTLESVLANIADSLERQMWRRLDLIVRMIEPVMLLIMAGVVLVVVIALVLPMMRMGMTV